MTPIQAARIFSVFSIVFFSQSHYAKSSALGTCNFEGQDWMCGYEQGADDNFDWQLRDDGRGGHYMQVQTELHPEKSNAKLISPVITQQDTHCFSFDFMNEGITSVTKVTNFNSTPVSNVPSSGLPGRLNVYVLDHANSIIKQPVWKSQNKAYPSWETVTLALNPRAYQVVFEAVVLDQNLGVISLDNIKVTSSACESAPHFLRLGNKEVNAGQNQTLQCLLWGYSGSDAQVVLEKSSGDIIQPTSKKEHSDHLVATFRFVNVKRQDSGMYRCISHKELSVGVSNYAELSVRVPPVPTRGPKVVKPGATSMVIQLNADQYHGDGPVVQKILNYRPVNGDWSDVHHIDQSEYELWHLQPDTEYQISVTLARSGPGGIGAPGPKLVRKTKCGPPVRSVKITKWERLGSHEIKLAWEVPDLSIVQCRQFSYLVRYRQYIGNNSNVTPPPYKLIPVENQNVTVISGLEPYTKYNINVELLNIIGSQSTGEFTIQTKEGVPGPVPPKSFRVTHSNETSVTLTWDEPLKPNAELVYYDVLFKALQSYNPAISLENETGFQQVEVNGQELTLTLQPGTEYLFQVRAKTLAGIGPLTETTAATDIAAPTMPQYPQPSETNSSSVTTPTTIEIVVIPAEGNGAPISNYYVIIEDVTDAPPVNKPQPKNKRKGKRRRNKNRNRNRRDVITRFDDVTVSRQRRQADDAASSACQKNPVSYETAKKDNSTSYAGAKFSPDQLQQETKFTVGDGSAYNGYPNPPLDPNRDYKIYIRVESEANGKTKVACVLAAVKAHVPPQPTPLPPTNQDKPTGENPDGPTGSDGGRDVVVIPPGGDPYNDQDDDVMMYAAVGGAAVGFLIITIAIILVIIRYRRQKKGTRKEEVVNPFEVRMMMSEVSTPAHTFLPGGPQRGSEGGTGERQHLMPDVVGYEHHGFHSLYAVEKASENGGTGYGGASSDERFAVRVDDFHVHVSQMKATGGYGFREEFAALPDGKNAPWIAAESPQNRGKNRYGNVMAYDHSRVVLDPVPGREEEYNGDYINASFINGYRKPGMYIATQAPSSETASDFWWMIWQEKSSVVVMVTNLVEMGKRKSDKYWPDDQDVYGTVQVSLSNQERTADYVIRSFVIQQSDGYEAREVKQFHFTSWPDHGVPSRPTNLLSFVRRVKAYEPQGQGPTVVHCSAGSGRTGCYITIDMMLDMAREEEIVDIHNTVRDLRTRRVNMVQTEEQYVFIHESVLEALLCGETSVSADMLVQHYDDLITVDPQSHFAPIQEEFETLNVITPKLSEEECSVARLPRNKGSNRFMDVLPADRHLAYLVTSDPSDKDNNYINAVYCDSYSTSGQFLVTQMPLPSTVIDIWRLIYDHKCNSVVMMNDHTEHDENCVQYWPESGSATYGPFTVTLLTKDDEVDVVSRLFKIQNNKRPGENYRLVQQFQLTNWPGSQPVPFSRNAVLRVVQLASKWQTECARNGDKGRIAVHCVAGAGRSGTFVSCYNMCEQMRQEFSVDVFNTVQRLRNVRPQLVETLEQYRFCYEVGIEFADQ